MTADVGDRISVVAAKGAPARQGRVVARDGSMLTVEWDDHHQSSFYPAPGSVLIQGRTEAETNSGRKR